MRLHAIATLLLALAAAAAMGAEEEKYRLEEVSPEELNALIHGKTRPVPKKPIEPFDEEEAKLARERVIAHKEKLEKLESMADEAMAKWNKLTREQQAEVIRQAQWNAAKRQRQILKDVELAEKLTHKEMAELEEELDRKIQREEEERKRREDEESERDMKEFEERKRVHRERQFKIRTTELALTFWASTFAISVAVSGLVFSRI